MKQLMLDVHQKLIVDLFAGGGGMSVAFERAFGRSPDIAINHDNEAISLHKANHPLTDHYVADIFEVCPHAATQGRPVGWLHLSPDCTHHSQASGGQPRSKKIRGLAWVGRRWAGQVLPDVISLENVKQVLKWGPLIAKRDKATGRVVKLDRIVAAPGERVPVQQQYLVPDPRRAGQTWRQFVAKLRALGYVVEWRVLCAADFGGHTTRERLFMLARRDGSPIVWPEKTHHKKPGRGQRRWKAAAECIDFTNLGKSIFERPKPLAEATLRRIAKGIKKFVLDNPKPFVVQIAHYSNGSSDRIYPSGDPLRTITAGTNGGEFALVTPHFIQYSHSGDERIYPASDPLRTVTARKDGLDFAVVMPSLVEAPFLSQANAGFNETIGRDLREPATTITGKGSQQQLVVAHLSHLRGNCNARDINNPLMTVSAGGQHHGFVAAMLSSLYSDDVHRCRALDAPTPTATASPRFALVDCELSSKQTDGAERVLAFLLKYYGTNIGSDMHLPAHGVTTKDRFALITVWVSGKPYIITDIHMRMLTPRELYRAQDFPEDYIIDRGHDGRASSKMAQIRMCGNSVNPVCAAAFLRVNAPWLAVGKRAA